MEENNTCWLSQLIDYFEVQFEEAANLKVVCNLCKPKEKSIKHYNIYSRVAASKQTYTIDTICYVHLRIYII